MWKLFSAAALAVGLVACTTTGEEPGPQTLEAELPETPVEPQVQTEFEEGYGPAPYAHPALDGLRSLALRRFAGEEAYQAWLEATEAARDKYGSNWGWGWGMDDAIPMPAPVAESAAPMASAAPSDAGTITVTASAPDNPSITNNQIAGVEEGDIVKQIGNFLVMLQDGRLFVVDLKPGGEDGLELVERANVYRSPDEDTWYDEMLVTGNRILVTGYSYLEDATEFSVLTLGEDGAISREAVFYITSDDYFDTENYATRMIGDTLVIHTPIFLDRYSPFDPVPSPIVRSWRRESEEGERLGEGEPVLKAEDIYRPVQRVLSPVIHTITFCDIGAVTAQDAPPCRSTAVIASERYEFLVDNDAFWLWAAPGWSEMTGEDEWQEAACMASVEDPVKGAVPAALFRIPLDGGEPDVAGVRGVPINQFGMDTAPDEFRAMVRLDTLDCWSTDAWEVREEAGTPDDALVALAQLPFPKVMARYADAADGLFTRLPSIPEGQLENRFTADHLLYSGREGWYDYAPDPGEEVEPSTLVVVPMASPDAPVMLALKHTALRIDRAGPYGVVTGYLDSAGLRVSLISLGESPDIASMMQLDGRYESESRSHAFNARIGADGGGVMGLPTVKRTIESGRWAWWSDASDLSVLTVAPGGKLAYGGTLLVTEDSMDERYECEVSCVDWYGNSRPIFTGGRLLALLDSELVEGVLENGSVREIRRVNLTRPLPPTPAPEAASGAADPG